MARLVIGRPRAVLLTAAMFVALSLVVGHGVADRLTVGGFEDPSTESGRADALLDDVFGAGTPNMAVIVTTSPDVREPAVAAAGTFIVGPLAAIGEVQRVDSSIGFYSRGAMGCVSRSGCRWTTRSSSSLV